MNNSQEFLRETPVKKLLLSMSVPVILSMLMQSLYNIVDSIWVAKLGTDAITAVSLAFPLQNIIMSTGVGMGIGIGSLISMNLGSGSRSGADRIASVGMTLSIFHSLLFILIGLTVTEPFLAMFTDDPRTLSWACDYTTIVLCLSSGQIIQMCLEKIFQGLGKMKTTMYFMASGCIINVILDPILIFGWFGAPAMGVTGAALATVIGQFGGLILYIIVCLKKDIGVTIHPRLMKPDRTTVRTIYSIGIPSSLMLSMPSLLTAILNGILTSFGSIYVAVFGLYFKLQTFVNMPSNGVVQGMRPIIGYNYGAGEQKRVRQTIRFSMELVAVIMLIGTIAALFFPGPILALFDADQQLMEYGIPALQVIGLSFLISTPGVVSCGVFEAMGRGKDSLTISLLRQLVIIVPLGWLLSRPLGPLGIWLAFPAAEAIAAAAALKKLKACLGFSLQTRSRK